VLLGAEAVNVDGQLGGGRQRPGSGVANHEKTAAEKQCGRIQSPMVGTAYLRPTPDAKPFVEIGASVKTGDKLMLVEAMKTFNEIVAHKSGKLTQIMIEDGAPVEYGQALMVIE